MSRSPKAGAGLGAVPRGKRSVAMVVVALTGFALAVVAGLAVAKSFTLKVSKSVHVDNTALAKGVPVKKLVNVHESVAVGPNGYAVYTFQGETTHHLICKKTTSQATDCWAFWPPVTVTSTKGLSAQTGIKGKLGTFKNHGRRQLTLGGKPLYNFIPDITSHNKKAASGDELKTFGSTWHIVTASGGSVTHGGTSFVHEHVRDEHGHDHVVVHESAVLLLVRLAVHDLRAALHGGAPSSPHPPSPLGRTVSQRAPTDSRSSPVKRHRYTS